MRTAVDFENVVVKVFHAEAKSRDAHFTNRLEFVVGERARLTFERDFLGLVPRQQRLHAAGQMLELVRREIGRGAAAEVDEVRFAPADERLRGVKRQLRKRRVKVSLDFGRILVGIDLEIAEVAALPAKWNVDVDAQRRCWLMVDG